MPQRKDAARTQSQVRILRAGSPWLIATLKLCVLDLQRRCPDSHLGVATGAWSSPKVIQDLHVKAAQEFTWMVHKTLLQLTGNWYKLAIWANVMSDGDAIGQHDHIATEEGANEWSGVYYLTGGAAITFEDGHSVRPAAGRHVIFPASLKHSVGAHRGIEQRISVAWNALPDRTRGGYGV